MYVKCATLSIHGWPGMLAVRKKNPLSLISHDFGSAHRDARVPLLLRKNLEINLHNAAFGWLVGWLVARLVIPEHRRRSCFLQNWRRPIFYVDTPKATGQPCDGGNTATDAAVGECFVCVLCRRHLWYSSVDTPWRQAGPGPCPQGGVPLIHLERRCET